jgi:hypothetical protein
VPELDDFAAAVWQRFELLASSPEAGERDHWQDSFELQRGTPAATLTLLVRGATLPGDARLLVFDDITESSRRSARRGLERGGAAPGARDQEPADADPAVGRAPAAQAGGQARRHRPGDAGAQRGHHRQPGAGDEALVNEFRDYARLPAAQLARWT